MKYYIPESICRTYTAWIHSLAYVFGVCTREQIIHVCQSITFTNVKELVFYTQSVMYKEITFHLKKGMGVLIYLIWMRIKCLKFAFVLKYEFHEMTT